MSQKLTPTEYEEKRDESDPSAAEIMSRVGDFQKAAAQASESLGHKVSKSAPVEEVDKRISRAVKAVLLRRGEQK